MTFEKGVDRISLICRLRGYKMFRFKKITKELESKYFMSILSSDLFIVLFLIFSNLWIWKIARHSSVLAFLLITLTTLLVYKKNFVVLIILSLLSIFLLRSNFDTNLLYISPLEKDLVASRHEYLAQGIGRFYRNRLGLYYQGEMYPYMYKIYSNFFFVIDPNLYFFDSHPRERVGVGGFAKFSALTLPLFILGLYTLIRGKLTFVHGYFLVSIAVSTLIFPGYELGPVLMFPFIVYVLYLGFHSCLDLLK